MPIMPDYKILPAGDTALVVEFGEGVDRRLSQRVLSLARRLNQAKTEDKIDGMIETVPTFRSLMVYYDPLVLPAASLTACIDELMKGLRLTEDAGRVWRLPVCYDASLAPDLGEVATRTALSPAQVVERHSAVTYHVYMLGFLPGQAYMGDVPAELSLARRDTPRVKIPAGSLAIAMNMTCIFPLQTPCGWHLIGRSPIPLWDSRPGSGALLAPGDQVTFSPVSVREYESLLARAADGTLKIVPSEGSLGAAA
jgi:KipI family sensor histidine kinase inhibitor